MTRKIIRVGTRGSILATTQTNQVVELLRQRNPSVAFEVVTAKTLGDKDQTSPLSAFRGQGIFVKELEELLLAGSIDLAVHSLKDVPSVVAQGCVLAAFPPRQDPRDVLITRAGTGLESLPQNALVGTGSPRRIVQIKAVRGDLRFAEIRGNLDTRIKKLKAGDYDAIVVAAAGLNRLGIPFNPAAAIEETACIPAIGQGALAIECRIGDYDAIKIALSVNDPATENEIKAERLVMETIGAGCKVPLACLARKSGNTVKLIARAGDPATGTIISREVTLPENQISMGAVAFANGIMAACKAANISLGGTDA